MLAVLEQCLIITRGASYNALRRGRTELQLPWCPSFAPTGSKSAHIDPRPAAAELPAARSAVLWQCFRRRRGLARRGRGLAAPHLRRSIPFSETLIPRQLAERSPSRNRGASSTITSKASRGGALLHTRSFHDCVTKKRIIPDARGGLPEARARRIHYPRTSSAAPVARAKRSTPRPKS